MTGKLEEPKVRVKKGEEPALPKEEAMKTFSDSAEIFQLMESRDEDQMMKDILGVYSKEYVYDIPFKGSGSELCETPNCSLAKRKIKHTHVRGLSWAGIKEARRIFQAIDTQQVSRPEVIEMSGKKLWDCSATAIDLRTGNATTVHKRQPFLKTKKDGSLMEDPFAFEIVQSKSKRNAIAELLPQPLVRAWIKDWTVGKKDFDPKHAVHLQKGRDFQVDKDDTKKDSADKGGSQRRGTPTAVKPTELQFRKAYAQWHEIEEKGGQSFADTREAAKEMFKVKSLQDLTRQQLSRIIDDNTKELAKISGEPKTDEPKEESDEHTTIQQVESPEATEPGPDAEPVSAPTIPQKVKLIKDALSELGWSPDEPALTAMLKTHGISSLTELDKASVETLDAILLDIGG